MNRIEQLDEKHVVFQCPGCGQEHCIPTSGVNAWSFNGDLERPTLQPSILAKGVKIKLGPDGKWNGEWERGEDGKPLPNLCHSFVTNGRIQFLSDSNHKLAGLTVDLPVVQEG